MAPGFCIDIEQVKGFLSAAEGNALYSTALATGRLGPSLEIGSYCGKSTLYLAAAAARCDSMVFAVDHHSGSEEHQPGEFFHDPELLDPATGGMDSFRCFRSSLRAAKLEDWVVPLVAPSERVARFWTTALGLVFIDGGHSLDAAVADYRCWAHHICRGGMLAIHDVHARPEDGGQAPRAIWLLAKNSGLFEAVDQVGSLALLRRL